MVRGISLRAPSHKIHIRGKKTGKRTPEERTTNGKKAKKQCLMEICRKTTLPLSFSERLKPGRKRPKKGQLNPAMKNSTAEQLVIDYPTVSGSSLAEGVLDAKWDTSRRGGESKGGELISQPGDHRPVSISKRRGSSELVRLYRSNHNKGGGGKGGRKSRVRKVGPKKTALL